MKYIFYNKKGSLFYSGNDGPSLKINNYFYKRNKNK